jgi:hypothetical protein
MIDAKSGSTEPLARNAYDQMGSRGVADGLDAASDAAAE